MWMMIAKGLLYFWAACFAVSFSVVVGGNLLGSLARKVRPIDATQRAALDSVRPGLLGRAWGVLVETGAQVLTVTADVHRALGLWPAAEKLQGPGQGTPVLVLPGYMESVASMSFLAKYLRKQGFRVEQAEFPSTYAPIARNAEFLRKRIAEVRERTSADTVAVVAHSMGGVITRCMMLQHPDDHHVQTLVCFASPHRGVTWSVGAPGRSTADMTWTSAHMKAFPITARCGVPVNSVVGLQDQIVNPVWAAFTEEGHNAVIDLPAGHMAPMFTRQGRELAQRFLVEAGVDKETDPAA